MFQVLYIQKKGLPLYQQNETVIKINIMKTKEILINVLIIISVFTVSLLIASTLVESEKQKYSQLKSK